jgi:hypothetical protein
MLSKVLSERWARRLTYGLMSVFVTFHAVALIVGPAPRDNLIATTLRPVVDPYLDLLYLNVGWGFFAPVGMTSEFRYSVVDADGKKHTFMPTRGLAWYYPGSLWVKDRFRTIAQFSERYGPGFIAEACRAHADLRPKEVILFELMQEKLLTPEDYKAGKAALDPEFSTTLTLMTEPCPKP